MSGAPKSSWPELRDVFNHALVEDIAKRVASHAPRFSAADFVTEVATGLPALALKGRSRLIAEKLHHFLPAPFPKALRLLNLAMGADDRSGGIEGMSGFRFMPFLDFVGMYGVDTPEISFDALEIMTKYFSAEFAIRPFLARHTALTLARARGWARHPDWRVRRLASEGLRPRLPWAERVPPLIGDPMPVIRILDVLRADPHPNVRNSVANSLNDIAKDHPALAVATAARWNKSGDATSSWIAKRGLRTLIKAGDAAALKVCGFDTKAPVTLAAFRLAPTTARIGGQVAFSFRLSLRGGGAATVAVDYALSRPLANGASAEKVFKLAVKKLVPGAPLKLAGKVNLKQLSTRRYYPGRYAVTIIANGQRLKSRVFTASP